eukprot:g31976.t1
MVSHTISIFCALLMEMAVSDLLVQGLVDFCGESPTHTVAEVIVHILLFPAWFFAITFTTWWVQESGDTFVGIDLFVHVNDLLVDTFTEQGTFSISNLMLGNHLAGPLLAVLTCKLFSVMSHWVRRKKLMNVMEQKKAEECHGCAWASEAFHCELECSSILAGFIFRQALLIVVQCRPPKHNGDIEVPLAGPVMFLTIGALLSAKSLLAALSWKSNLKTFLQLLMGMAACWCFMSLIMYDIKQNIAKTDHRWLVLVAVVSAIAVSAMFIQQDLVVVCGIATGLAWEKSFAWAIREVIEHDGLSYNKYALDMIRLGSSEVADFTRRMKLLEVWAYIGMLAVIMPAWLWYIVPLANPHKEAAAV